MERGEKARAAVIVAGWARDGGAALRRTLCSVAMQCGAEAVETILVAPRQAWALGAFAGASCAAAEDADGVCAAWMLGARRSEAPYALLLREGDALFDAYSLWRLLRPTRETPGPDAVFGSLDEPQAFLAPQGKLWRRQAVLDAGAKEETALAALCFVGAETQAQAGTPVCACAIPGGLPQHAAVALEEAGAPPQRCALWAEQCLASLYVAYVRAGACGGAAEEARRRCEAFYRGVSSRFEAFLPPEALFASYSAAMEAAMRADPQGVFPVEPYPLFVDLLRTQAQS